MPVSEIYWQQQASLPWLSLLVVWPLLSMLAVGASASRTVRSIAALGGVAIELLMTGWVLMHFEHHTAALQFVERLTLADGLFNYHVGIDGISVLFLPLTALLILQLVLLAVAEGSEREPVAVMTLLGYEAVLMGLYVSIDMSQFWLFLFAEMLPAGVLVGRLGTAAARAGTVVYLLKFLAFALLLLLVAFGAIAWQHARSSGTWTCDWTAWLTTPLASHRQPLVFGLLMFAIGIRLPAFPFHGWFPAVAQNGPVATVAVALVGIKLGVYALLRLVLPLVPEAAHTWSRVVVSVGLLGTLYTAMLACMQLNLRRLLAYGACSQAGLLLVAVFSLEAAALDGALLLALNFGLTLSGLFLITACMVRRTGTALLPRLGRRYEFVSLISLTFLMLVLGNMALPGSPGFAAAVLALEGILAPREWPVTVLAGVGTMLASGYLVRAYQRLFLARGKSARNGRGLPDLDWVERGTAAVLCLSLFGISLYATSWLDIIAPSTANLVQHLRSTGAGKSSTASHRPLPPSPVLNVDPAR